MSSKKTSSFKVSSGLKTILGKELITNDFIAVFELVKNSFDAEASKVDVFYGEVDGETSLVIQDDGCGMSESDLVNKWLFVAYSAKKQSVDDYRHKIQGKRITAGSKGIGRFSCDKLGEYLSLYTKKEDGTLLKLEVDWALFESNQLEEIESIPVSIATNPDDPFSLEKGTILHISNLREKWDRGKLKELRSSLEKLISPVKVSGANNFTVSLTVPSEAKKDKTVPKDKKYDQINGKIENRILSKLEGYCTKIIVETTIENRKNFIKTSLFHKGKLVYEILEKNTQTYSKAIRGSDDDIETLQGLYVEMFYLNPTAKRIFTRHMGIRPVHYGSLFLYKNGFRVHQRGADVFGINYRKQQGGSRVVGLRELLGYISIQDDDGKFTEVSSRDGGLIESPAYEAMTSLVVDYGLKRIEKFAINVARFEKGESFDQHKELSEDEFKSETLSVVAELTSSKEIKGFKVGKDFWDVMTVHSQKSIGRLITNFKRYAVETGDDSLAKEVRLLEKREKQLRKAAEESEAEAEQAKEDAKKALEEARVAKEKEEEEREKREKLELEEERLGAQNHFLRRAVDARTKSLIDLLHEIKMYAEVQSTSVKQIVQKLQSGEIPSKSYLLETLSRIDGNAARIYSISNFAEFTDESIDGRMMVDDVVGFIVNYLKEVVAKEVFSELSYSFEVEPGLLWEREFDPVELTMAINNIVSNAEKNNAASIGLKFWKKGSFLHIRFSNDGDKIPSDIRGKIFELGYSSKGGSGVGLSQVKEALEDGLDAKFVLNDSEEVQFEIIVEKK